MKNATIKLLSDVSYADVPSVGGKAAGLGELLRAGVAVPGGFVVTAEAAKRSSGDVADAVLGAFDSLGAPYVAVRSSAIAEDASGASWAGQLETFLYVRRQDLMKQIEDCWASASSPRAQSYAQANGSSGGVAVVVQQMIASDVSGIAFSANPVTNAKDEIVIEAGLGLGEAVVSGKITPDTYVVRKAPISIIDKDIAIQPKQLHAAANGGTVWQEVGHAGTQQKLTDVQIGELANIVLKVERHFGKPMDIEWALATSEFFLLQSRPITTLE